MNITLISPYADVTSIGVRILSSCLKRAGHNCRMVFLPRFEQTAHDSQVLDSEHVCQQLAELCAEDDLIGISVMTNYFDRATHITERLKSKLDVPVVWGGVHPTTCPEECLKFADFAIVGEAEGALIDLVEALEKGKEYSAIQNLCFMDDGVVIRNSVRPLIADIDSIPFPDYSFDAAFIALDDNITPLTKDLMKQCMGFGLKIVPDLISYQLMASRGCPLNCAYCCNNLFRKLYKGQKYLRQRSVESILGELRIAKEKLDFVDGVWFSDDCFLERDVEEIEEFSRRYKSEIGKPFFCLGTPGAISERKMSALCDAGLQLITMGIQTGSLKTKRLYQRVIPNEKILSAARIINTFRDRLFPPRYDFLIDNPYEDYRSHYETQQLILQLPEPFHMQIFSLVLFPGTALYNRAREDGKLTDDTKQIYQNLITEMEISYPNALMLLHNHHLPRFIIRILSAKPFFFLFDRPFATRILTPMHRFAKRLFGKRK